MDSDTLISHWSKSKKNAFAYTQPKFAIHTEALRHTRLCTSCKPGATVSYKFKWARIITMEIIIILQLPGKFICGV